MSQPVNMTDFDILRGGGKVVKMNTFLIQYFHKHKHLDNIHYFHNHAASVQYLQNKNTGTIQAISIRSSTRSRIIYIISTLNIDIHQPLFHIK